MGILEEVYNDVDANMMILQFTCKGDAGQRILELLNIH